jgi:ParB-like chromosome segregation protein Spo0J
MYIDIQIERWPIERLIPRINNPRTHNRTQIANIAASIQEFGWTNPILVGAEGDIIAGHARVLAARKLGMEQVPVIVLKHLSPAQRRALVIADNQLAIAGAGWDEEMLRIELAILHEEDYDLNLVGFDDIELQRLLEAQDTAEGLTDEDAVPEITETPISATGDLWALGDHKLVVGDATVRADVDRLMLGEAADLVFTDPPYNVDYEGYTEDRLKIKGDGMTPEQFRQFLLAHVLKLSGDRETGRLDVRLSFVILAARIPERDGGRRLRGPLSDYLGEEYVRLGFRPLQVST